MRAKRQGQGSTTETLSKPCRLCALPNRWRASLSSNLVSVGCCRARSETASQGAREKEHASMSGWRVPTSRELWEDHSTALLVSAGITASALLGLAVRRAVRGRVPRAGPFKGAALPAGAYDAVIVGSGPAGSTCGFYLARAGARVALLDKATFPRDKYCGDAVCTPAIHILEEMGVLQELVAHDEAHFADAGGFVSPSGLSYIGKSKERLGGAAACAVKRTDLDARMAHKARDTGADLREGFEVADSPRLDPQTGLWTVTSAQGAKVQGRVLVIADGATSRLATQMGYCTEPPKGVCSRAFIEGGSHNVNFDGVCFYHKESLPGYSAIFKHAKDELNFCYYLIPCGKDGMCGDVKESDLRRLHENAITSDPFVSRALGPTPKVERMKAAALRLGGQGVPVTYDDHLLIIGDAAGHIDPLTGEGIHTAMMGGRAAADTVLDMRRTGDFSRASTRAYERRWWAAYGHDFGASVVGANLMYRYPLLLDACAAEMQRRGDSMMSKWAEVMTNMRPKTYFLQPHVAVPLGIAVVREWWSQKVSRRRTPLEQLISG